jgi:DNA topoisomerase-1
MAAHPQNLVVVESPAKCKTIKKTLGKGFEVLASYGHVVDLIPKEGAVDPDNNFAMKYQEIERNAKHVDALAKVMKKADALYLATDPDREGEAISWHVYQVLKARKLLENKPVYRVVFNEITKTAITEAIANPRELCQDLVDAQVARRALDYLVGFNLSPLIWRKIKPGLSAGRVQSPALRMIVEREEEIEKFVAEEYWSIVSHDAFEKQKFDARLTILDDKKVEQFTITTEKQSTAAKKKLEKAADGKLVVAKVDKKKRKRQPTAPFITSTLQQEAVRKLGFTAQRAMRTAQQLYEGVELGEDGPTGLITYMRTDSVHMADEAVAEIRKYVEEQYGKKALPGEPRVFKTKSKNAQEAHEAIRPTSAYRTPEGIKDVLTQDQYKLYQLIWKRAVACQMLHATMHTVAVDLACGKKHQFRANGSTIADPGFMRVYLEGKDDSKADDDEKLLPEMEVGDIVDLNEVECLQHFTEPPPRYSEASIVKALEEFGIGRPSTYASIIATLLNREYVTLDKKRFHPSDVGRVVSKFLTTYFTQYVDYEFTANLENQLDQVACGEQAWMPVLEKFWAPFKEIIDHTAENVSRKDVTQEEMDEDCPECGKKLSTRLGRRGKFVGCTAYPECKYTRNMDGEEGGSEPEIVEGRSCPKCEENLVIKLGRYGKFIGCSTYPTCKHIEPLEKPTDTGVQCCECKEGQMLKRKSRYGKIFYSCEHYPKCKYAVWDEPFNVPCPTCKWPITTKKITKRRGEERMCPQKECDYRVEWDGPEAEGGEAQESLS